MIHQSLEAKQQLTNPKKKKQKKTEKKTNKTKQNKRNISSNKTTETPITSKSIRVLAITKRHTDGEKDKYTL